MARPREFDEAKVLDAASDIFWAKGFEATSTRDLTACTGLTSSSIYAAFGDKRGLFRRALDHYLERLREKMANLEATCSPAQAITGFFEDTIVRMLDDTLQRGCMLVNSSLEASPDDPDIRDDIAGDLTLIERFFHERFLEGQASGDISRNHSADDAARQLLAMLLGVRVLGRVRPEASLLFGAAGQALSLLGLPPLKNTANVRAKRSSRRSA